MRFNDLYTIALTKAEAVVLHDWLSSYWEHHADDIPKPAHNIVGELLADLTMAPELGIMSEKDYDVMLSEAKQHLRSAD
jgi:hypothetical protein